MTSGQPLMSDHPDHSRCLGQVEEAITAGEVAAKCLMQAVARALAGHGSATKAISDLELAALRLRPKHDGGPPPDPSDPADPVSCLELWLAALHGRRAQLLRPLH
jgi:hypothetical protein